jgi:hypothetical protein
MHEMKSWKLFLDQNRDAIMAAIIDRLTPRLAAFYAYSLLNQDSWVQIYRDDFEEDFEKIRIT